MAETSSDRRHCSATRKFLFCPASCHADSSRSRWSFRCSRFVLTLNSSKFDGGSSNAVAASVQHRSLVGRSHPDSVRGRSKGATPPASSSTATATSTTAGPSTSHSSATAHTPLAIPAPSHKTVTTTTVKSRPISAGGPVFGVSLPALITQTPATQAAWLANIKGIGITSVRIGANCAWIQYGGPTSYDWSQLDQEIASIRAAGLSIDLVITGAPPWAAVPSAASDPSPQPADPASFGAFAGAVAARYAPEGVRDFEIWNEPNNVVFWQPAPNPGRLHGRTGSRRTPRSRPRTPKPL